MFGWFEPQNLTVNAACQLLQTFKQRCTKVISYRENELLHKKMSSAIYCVKENMNGGELIIRFENELI